MNRLLLFALLICLPLKGYMQLTTPFKWAKMISGKGYWGVSVTDAKTDDSGNVIICGQFSDSADFDPGPAVHILKADSGNIFLVKLDSSGKFKWARNFGNSGGVFLNVDHKGNIFCGGGAAEDADFDPGPAVVIVPRWASFITKWEPDGTLSWVRDIRSLDLYPVGGIGAREIHTDGSGNVYILGLYCGSIDVDPGPLVRVLNCGVCGSSGGTYLIKLDENGTLVWAKNLTCPNAAWGGFAYDQHDRMQIDSKDNIYYLETFTGSVDFDPGPADSILSTPPRVYETVLCKLDSSLNLKWVRRQCAMGALAIDKLDNVYLHSMFENSINLDPGKTGHTLYAPAGEKWNGLVMKVDSGGVFQWGKGISGLQDYQYFHRNVIFDSHGDLYLLTTLRDSAVLYDRTSRQLIAKIKKPGTSAALLRMDNAGKLKGGKIVLDTIAESSLRTCQLNIDQKDNIVLTGSFKDTVDADPDAGTELLISKLYRSLFAIKLGPTIPLSLHALAQAENCTVFPNPTQGPLTLMIDGFKDQAAITVFDQQGKRILSRTTNESLAELDLSMYHAGLYLIQVSDAQRETCIKVLKQ
ncbi:MAG: T9SS type A sorting domain-containing protein [Chitinophagaceae bacterium]|nr:T9SS type A sorting domain-containing protein [Chitinophagaceae bacterium]